MNELNSLVAFAHLLLGPATAVHALLFKRDPRAALGWVAVCLLVPIGGPVLYVLFGINRVRTQAARLRGQGEFTPGYERGTAVDQPPPLPPNLEPEYGLLARVAGGLSRHALLHDNEVVPLYNGEGAYPAMLEAIHAARRRVLFTTYILDTDDTGRAFIDALADAAARGVDVRVLVDGLGEWYSWPHASRLMARRGVRCARFLPPRLIPPSVHVNLRNHKKILVADHVGFTGGMNIGDRHLAAREDDPDRVCDLHFEVHGPVVSQLEQVFLDSWEFATGEHTEPLSPPPPAGRLYCRVITDGPDEDLDRLTILFTAAISLARERVLIMTPYFLPPREIIGALQAAAVRGVDVLVVLPERNNLPYVHWATRNMLWELLIRGVRVVYQPPPFVHTKLFVIDRCYTLLGSANWDSRSLRLNFELGLEVYGAEFAAASAAHIDQAAARGAPVTMQELDARPFLIRLRDSICWLFTPYL